MFYLTVLESKTEMDLRFGKGPTLSARINPRKRVGGKEKGRRESGRSKMATGGKQLRKRGRCTPGRADEEIGISS